eukprot:Hpha_TRINITY_DN15593_c0_g1::TRINITY_DN15593_c0_g1_i1::g.104802::m.104802
MAAMLALAALSAIPETCPHCVEGVVLGGVDVVATRGQAPGAGGVMGDPGLSADFGGYTFHFANASTRAQFVAAPAGFVPAFGGFCAYGTLSRGAPVAHFSTKHMGPPCGGPNDAYLTVNNTLLCINRLYASKFLTMGASGVDAATAVWNEWFGGPELGPMNSGCFPGLQTAVCIVEGKTFPNRTTA